MRLEVNISLRTAEMEEHNKLPDYRVEIKNINSFRYMERAIRAEIVRQRAIFERGETPVQENRGYDEDKDETISQRGKEEANDYRYFPEPDIPPMHFEAHYFEKLKIPFELPSARRDRLISEFGLPERTVKFIRVTD
jgi:aspartyl-tRNA(Asn)/glutamyl-tRNA(Gln) amidotransferase subunit B